MKDIEGNWIEVTRHVDGRALWLVRIGDERLSFGIVEADPNGSLGEAAARKWLSLRNSSSTPFQVRFFDVVA